MAWTYTALLASIQTYLQSDEAIFVAEIPTIVKQAEDRILKKAQLPVFKKTDAGVTVDGTVTLAIPSDFLAPYYLTIDDSGAVPLIFKNASFIHEAYPASGTKATPKYYAIQDDTNFLLGPTPDSAYTTELYYFYRPTSIVDGATSWLGTNAESALLYACLVEAYTFLKGDSELLAVYDARANDAIADLKILGEGRNTTDMNRNG